MGDLIELAIWKGMRKEFGGVFLHSKELSGGHQRDIAQNNDPPELSFKHMHLIFWCALTFRALTTSLSIVASYHWGSSDGEL